jgi:hypothetical protein
MLIPHEFTSSVPHFGWKFYDIDRGFPPSNHSLLMVAERFVMSLKCSARSSEQEIGVSGYFCAFGPSTLW